MNRRNKIPLKRMNPALAVMTQQKREDLIIRSSSKANLLLTLMVLHDKFGYEETSLNRFLEEYRKQLEAYNEGYIERVKDFEDVLWEECGIKVEL